MTDGTVAEVLAGTAQYALICARSEDAIRDLQDESIDFYCGDPPYGLGTHEPSAEDLVAYLQGAALDTGGDFMAEKWSLPGVDLWREVYRVLKPGAFVAVFGGTQTDDLLSIGLRAAGFERCDAIDVFGTSRLAWVQAQGMKHGIVVGKAIDEAAGCEREIVGSYALTGTAAKMASVGGSAAFRTSTADEQQGEADPDAVAFVTAPASAQAAEWEGWETGLAPKHEVILLFRKPLASVTSEQLHQVTGWDHWHVVTPLRKPTARVRAVEKWGATLPDGGEARTVERRPLRDGADGWGELQHRHVYRFKRIRCVDGVAKASRERKFGEWTVLKSTERQPYKPWKISTVTANVLVHGAGAMNIDATRVYTDWSERSESWKRSGHSAKPDAEKIAAPPGNGINCHPNGRHTPNIWFCHSAECERAGERTVQSGNPGNVRQTTTTDVCYGKFETRSLIGHATADGLEHVVAYACLAGCPTCLETFIATSGGAPPACPSGHAAEWICDVARLDQQGGVRKSGARSAGARNGMGYHGAEGDGGPEIEASEGNLSRYFHQIEVAPEDGPFFFNPKASRAERDAGLTSHCRHVAIKPQGMLRRVVRLIGRKGAIGLTCHAGAGSEVAAMVAEGCRAIGIEMEQSHVDTARLRVPALVAGRLGLVREEAVVVVAPQKEPERPKKPKKTPPPQLPLFAMLGDAQ